MFSFSSQLTSPLYRRGNNFRRYFHYISIKDNSDKIMRFNSLWLRDHCRCSECYHSQTKQRLHITNDFPLNLTPMSVVDNGHNVKIVWPGESTSEHVSIFEKSWLESNQLTSQNKITVQSRDPALDTVTQVRWQKSDFGNSIDDVDACNFPSVDYKSFMSNDNVLLDGLEKLRDYGMFFIRGCPPTEEETGSVCERIGPIRSTLYGSGTWRTEIRPVDSINDTAYTALALPAHTDCNYLRDPPGIQVFHAIKHDKDGGGKSLLVDGFRIAEDMKAHHPESFKFLCNYAIPYHHTDPEWIMRARRPVFEVDPVTGNVCGFYFNNDDRDVVIDSEENVEALYCALKDLQSYILKDKYVVKVQLVEGLVLVFNNNRVLHGRDAFSTTSGRTLAGVYINQEDWMSKLRVLKDKL